RSPCGLRSLFRDCTTISLRCLSESFFTVATTVPITRASCISSLGTHDVHSVDHADHRGIYGRVFHVLGQSRARTRHHQHAFVKACAHRVHGHNITSRVRPIEVDGPNNEQLLTLQPFVFLGRHDCADDSRNNHARACALMGIASSTLPCGLGITCTLTSSPTRRAAAAPASVAALTAATSPRTIAVTKPAPIFSYPIRVTLAALTIASAASIIATSPLVSIIPSASINWQLLFSFSLQQSINDFAPD